MDKKLFQVFEYLINNHSKIAEDLIESYEFFASYISDAEDALRNDYATAIKNRSSDQDELYKISHLAEELRIRAENDVKSMDERYNRGISNQESSSNDNLIQDAPSQDDWKTLDYDFKSEKVICLCIYNEQYSTKDLTDALIKFCEVIYKNNQEKFREILNEDFIRGRTLEYITTNPFDEKYAQISNSGLYVLIHSNNPSKIKLMKNILAYFNISDNNVRMLIRSDYTPKPREYTGIKKSSNQKIGKYVREKMRLLSKSGYTFEKSELLALQNKKLTKQLVGISYPLLVSYQDMKNGKAKKEKYWNDILIFNGQEFYVTSQWKDGMKEGFDKWYRNLKS